jgi:hypothetical protein
VQTEEEKPKSAEWAREDRWASSHRECEWIEKKAKAVKPSWERTVNSLSWNDKMWFVTINWSCDFTKPSLRHMIWNRQSIPSKVESFTHLFQSQCWKNHTAIYVNS